jgi:predicted transcriptional regulator
VSKQKKNKAPNYPGRTLKQLQTHKTEELRELSDIERKLRELNQEKATRQDKVKKLDAQMKRLTKEVVVSEHAVLVYASRQGLIDIEAIKDTILAQTREPAKTLGSGRYPIGDGSGLKAVIKDGVVRTVKK